MTTFVFSMLIRFIKMLFGRCLIVFRHRRRIYSLLRSLLEKIIFAWKGRSTYDVHENCPIFKTSLAPVHLRPEFFHPLNLGCPILNDNGKQWKPERCLLNSTKLKYHKLALLSGLQLFKFSRL